MTQRQNIVERFAGEAAAPGLYLPNLTLWYAWHASRYTMPPQWQGATLPAVARALGVPIWMTIRPWRVEMPGVTIVREGDAAARSVRYETPAGALTARWAVGPDGDWWQTEHLVKSAADLPAARALVEARTYVLDAAEWAQRDAAVGDDGVVALELPRRPYSDLLHDFVGWGEGLMLLMGSERPAFLEMLEILEARLAALVERVVALPGALVYAPDNLDGQYISPRVFGQSLAESYRRTTETLHAAGKRLIVHAGGPCRRLLAPLAAAGVDAVEGIAGPPQGDATIAEARETAGPSLVLWGGLSQDLLVQAHDEAAFQAAVIQAARAVAADGRSILGVADRVPVEAKLSRLQDIPRIIAASM